MIFFRHERLAKKRKGERVRTIVTDKHRVRIAFPKGQRRKGAGRVLSILHPMEESKGRRKRRKRGRSNPHMIGELKIPQVS